MVGIQNMRIMNKVQILNKFSTDLRRLHGLFYFAKSFVSMQYKFVVLCIRPWPS